MNERLISLVFNWHRLWNVLIGLGAAIGITVWWFISAALIYLCYIAVSEEDVDTKGCFTIPIAIVWFALSAAIYAGMH